MVEKNITEILNLLEEMHPEAKCELDFETPMQTLVAVILSAQCTDKRVNIVTKPIFKKYKTAQDFASVPIKDLEEMIKPCGFYRNKAANISKCAKQILDEYNGEVPNTQEELQKLAGVGRKTANVVYAEVFKGDAIAVDTHVKRVSNRLGLAKSDDPEEVERQLMKLIPKEKWSRAHHLLIFFGRYTCKAINPSCGCCKLQKYCIKGK